ncbi:MAG: molybdopterin molybdotransferase MoeA [Planctomycetota bacterium]
MSGFKFASPDAALTAMAASLIPVSSERREVSVGAVIAEDIVADRDSPAANVSAMDGYAIHQALLQHDRVRVVAECAAGSSPPPYDGSGAIRIFTGAVVPDGCDTVVMREHTSETSDEQGDSITWLDAARANAAGANIRRQGENLAKGSVALRKGQRVDGPVAASLANFGITHVALHRRLSVAIVTTGGELIAPGTPTGQLRPWQIRNSNAAALAALLASHPAVENITSLTAADNLDELGKCIGGALSVHDAVLVTGGVSMGDYDLVPECLRKLGCTQVFHKLPIRPGKPLLGAIYEASEFSRLVFGLPGNPVSATACTRRFAFPLLDRIAGLEAWRPMPTLVSVQASDSKTLPLWWMRPVHMTEPGVAEIVAGRGSGDLASLAHSDGFIEVAPNDDPTSPSNFYRWAY